MNFLRKINSVINHFGFDTKQIFEDPSIRTFHELKYLIDKSAYIDSDCALSTIELNNLKRIDFSLLGCEVLLDQYPKPIHLTDPIAPWCPSAENRWLHASKIIYRSTKVFDTETKEILEGEYVCALKDFGEKTSIIFKIENGKANLFSIGSSVCVFQYRSRKILYKVYQKDIFDIPEYLYLPGIVYKSRTVNLDKIISESLEDEWEIFINNLSIGAINLYNQQTSVES